MLETKLPSLSPLSPPSSSLSSSSSISIPPSSSLSSSPLSSNPPSLSSSSSSVSFYIFQHQNFVCQFIFEFICVFLTTCFLLFMGFRCNILLTNISIDLLFLALVFLKNVSTFDKQFSKFIMCYNLNRKLVLELYLLFQSFRAILIMYV